MSASLWGCELKYRRLLVRIGRRLSASLWGCELKWDNVQGQGLCSCVSLLVRLWVEIRFFANKFKWYLVSLLVRLWVEIYLAVVSSRFPWSASLWGCELKLVTGYSFNLQEESASLWGCELKSCVSNRFLYLIGQPPCEAVSWNIRWQCSFWCCFPSASLWGCELKYRENVITDEQHFVSLLVRLWVEMEHPWKHFR